jgi:glycosylphosphatidylinositol transamidase
MIGILIAGTIGARAASSPNVRPIRSLLSSFNLCLVSTIITVVSLLNFSLAASIALRLGLPLTLSSSMGSSPVNDGLQSVAVVITAVGWLIGETGTYMREWALYGNWFAPFIWTVYLPLALQAVVAPYV